MVESIDIAVLQAEPLTLKDAEGRLHAVPGLALEIERSRLRESFSEAGVEVSARFEAATTETLRRVATLGSQVVLYSGHGAPQYLAFEDGRGGTHAIEPAKLRTLLAAGGNHVRLAVVSACHSLKAGEAFVEAGVPHVVAIRLETEVYDDAAIAFARAFILELLVGKTVGQAFEVGQAAVATIPWLSNHYQPVLLTPGELSEEKKFVLLPGGSDHSVTIFSGLQAGVWTDLTPELPHCFLPAAVEHFLGRELYIHQVIVSVLDHRLTTLHGAPGIGKSALASAAARYLWERRHFRNGVFWILLRGAVTPDAARAEIARRVGLQATDDEELFSQLKSLELLLIFDNCEDLLHVARVQTRDFLSRLLERTDNVRILVTSRQTVGALTSAGVNESLINVGQLESIAAARLFLELCGNGVRPAEIGSPEPKRFLKALSLHRALRFLAGHPLAIRLAAPLLRDLSSLDRLADLFEREPISIPDAENDRDGSLRATFNVSIRQIEGIDPKAFSLFAMFGLLPAGAFPSDLDAIWGDKSWDTRMDLLVRRGGLVQREPGVGPELFRFTTFPFVTSQAVELLSEEDRRAFGVRALAHFARRGEQLYQAYHGDSPQEARLLFGIQEPNLRACLDPGRPLTDANASQNPSDMARLANRLPALHLLENRLADGHRVAELTGGICRTTGDRLGEANSYKALGDISMRAEGLALAAELYERALDLYRDIKERLGEANTLKALGDLAIRTDEIASAERHYRFAFALYRDVDDLDERLGEASTRQALGDLALRTDDLESAEIHFKRALDLYRYLRVWSGEASSRKRIGVLAIRTGDLIGAEVDFEYALDQFSDGGDRAGEADTHLSFGDLLLRKADLTGAEKHFEKALALYREIGDRLGEATSLRVLGDLSFRTVDLPGAGKRYGLALSLFRELNSRFGEASTCQALGDLAVRMDDLAVAKVYYQSAIRSCTGIRVRLIEAKVRKGMGDLAARTDDLIGAEDNFTLALGLFCEISDRLGEATTRKALGDLRLHASDPVGAKEFYETAYRLFIGSSEKLGEATTRQALGDLAFRLNDLAGAERHYGSALNTYRAINARLGIANTLKAMGDLALRKEELSVAEENYEKALNLYVEIGARLGEANTRKVLGDLANRRNNLSDAEKYYVNALALYREIGDRKSEAKVRTILSDLNFSREEWAKAIASYEPALAIYEAFGSRVSQAETLFYLGQAYFKSGLRKEGLVAIARAAQLLLEIRDYSWAALAFSHQVEMLEVDGRSEEAQAVRASFESTAAGRLGFA